VGVRVDEGGHDDAALGVAELKPFNRRKPLMKLITNGRLITRDAEGRGYYEHGAVAYEGAKIAEVGEEAEPVRAALRYSYQS